jgi:hypothetical protein
MATALQLATQGTWDEDRANAYLRSMAEHRTEQEAELERIVYAGISADPPKDWKDPFAH